MEFTEEQMERIQDDTKFLMKEFLELLGEWRDAQNTVARIEAEQKLLEYTRDMAQNAAAYSEIGSF